MWIDSCSSTNDVAKELIQSGCAHGAWVASRVQTEGRGRSGSWLSGAGNLHLSIILINQPWDILTRIPLIVGCEVIDTIKSALPVDQDHFVLERLKLKWPNDLYWIENTGSPRKLGGILCESAGSGQGDATVVVGVGINLIHAPSGIVNPVPVSWRELFPNHAPIDPHFFAELLANRVAKRFFLESPAKVAHSNWKDEYLKYSLLQPGDILIWENQSGETQKGVMNEIGNQGELLVQLTEPHVQTGQYVTLMNETIRRVRDQDPGQ